VLHGAVGTFPFQAFAPVPAVPANGEWWVSPNKVRVKIDHIGFNGANGTGTGTELTNCTVEYDRSTPSLTNLLDCPFTIDHAVTALDINLQLNATFEVLISDPVNGIFSDASAAGGLSTSAPAGGATFISITSPNGLGSAGGPLAASVVLDETHPISLGLVMDAIQTLVVHVTGGAPTINAADNRQPVVLFPTFDMPGRAAFYSTAATAGSILVPSGYSYTRVYYGPGANSQPASVFATNIGPTTSATSAAYPIDPAQSPVLSGGARTGGWLGRDAAGTLCWVFPADISYSTYAGYLTLPELTTLGSSTTISSQQTATPAPPSAGSTYASGCPAITADTTKNVTLVAQ
jgi:hypothetical protein